MEARSELAVLVETETRLDRALAAARERASEIVETAKRQTADDARAVDEAIAELRTRIAREIAPESDRRVRALAETARTTCDRYDAVRGERLATIASKLARRVAELAEEDA